MAGGKGGNFGGYFEAGTNFRVAAQVYPALFGAKLLAIHVELQGQEKEFAILSLKELGIAAGSRFMGKLLRAVGVIDNAVNRGFQNSWSRQAFVASAERAKVKLEARDYCPRFEISECGSGRGAPRTRQ